MFETDEYRIADVRLGDLPFGRMGFVESLKLNTSIHKKLNIGEEIESRKFTILALATGVEWVAQGQPKRRPSRQRIDISDRGIRMGEILGGGTSSRTVG